MGLFRGIQGLHRGYLGIIQGVNRGQSNRNVTC